MWQIIIKSYFTRHTVQFQSIFVFLSLSLWTTTVEPRPSSTLAFPCRTAGCPATSLTGNICRDYAATVPARCSHTHLYYPHRDLPSWETTPAWLIFCSCPVFSDFLKSSSVSVKSVSCWCLFPGVWCVQEPWSFSDGPAWKQPGSCHTKPASRRLTATDRSL